MQLGNSQLVIDYLKIYYKSNFNENHKDVMKSNIKPIKSKIPRPPAFGGKPRSTPIVIKNSEIPVIAHHDDYDAIREQEKEYGEKMKYHFNLASKAYRRGDGATAKREAQEGNRYKNLFLQERYLNVHRTLASKNSHLNRAESIDLHGLHRNEVEYVLEHFINDIQSKLSTGEIVPNMGARRGHMVTIITGKGNNSRNNKSVIKIEVKEYLRCKGIGFKESDGYFTISIV